MAIWGDLKTIIKNDLDLNDETFINDEMLMAYVNNGLDEAEKIVLGLNEDYFLQLETIQLEAGTDLYALPSSILGYKIRKVLFDSATQPYEIRRMRTLADTMVSTYNDPYRYLIVNVPGTGARMKMYPTPQENATATIWYIGNATRIVDDNTVIDIPEAINFLITYVKLECARREGNPSQATFLGERERQRTLLVETLGEMVPDEDNEIILDTSFYEDHN